MAHLYNAHFLEISTVLNHLVDDLLVTIATRIKGQIEKVEKEKLKLEKKHLDRSNKLLTSGHGGTLNGGLVNGRGKGLGKFFKKHFSMKNSSTSSSHKH